MQRKQTRKRRKWKYKSYIIIIQRFARQNKLLGRYWFWWFWRKKGKAAFSTHLDETQKESDDNEEDNDYTLDIDKDIFGYEIFKKDENEKSYNNKDFSEQQGRFSQPMSCPQQTTNFNLNQCDDSFFCSPLGRFSYNCPQYQNKKESINQIINSPYHNQLNFFNNSFTMNGKSGWVCSHCKNFNYESKF